MNKEECSAQEKKRESEREILQDKLDLDLLEDVDSE